MSSNVQRPDSSKEAWLRWVEFNTRPLDLVASWEQLVVIYEQLHFLDPITDTERIAEFNRIIHEMNKQLSRMRSKLETARDMDAAVDYLNTQYDCSRITERPTLAYAKLKQVLVKALITELEGMKEDG